MQFIRSHHLPVRMNSLTLLVALLAGITFSLIPVSSVFAATYTVTNTNDKGAGSLRQAISSASAGSTITFDPSLAGKTITLTSGALTISKNLIVSGPGAENLTVSGGGKNRVFLITGARSKVTLSGLTIANGYAKSLRGIGINNVGILTVDGCVITNHLMDGIALRQLTVSWGGGGIYNSGTLTVLHSTISANTDKSYSMGGGGIYNDTKGKLTVTDTLITGNVVRSNVFLGQYGGGGIMNRGSATLVRVTVVGNSASGYTYGGGGGIYNDQTMTIQDSIIQDNAAPGTFGGGIINFVNGNLTMDRTTLSGNTAGQDGGGLENLGIAVVTNSTISGNTSAGTDYGGGGVDNTDGTLTVQNSTLANNSAPLKGGGLFNTDGTVTLDFTTFSGNTGGAVGNYYEAGTPAIAITNSILANDGGGECLNEGGGTISLANSVATDETCGTPLLLADPLLGALQNNGGLTETMEITPGSPALDLVECGAVAADQRGLARPSGAACDAGAYEWQAETVEE